VQRWGSKLRGIGQIGVGHETNLPKAFVMVQGSHRIFFLSNGKLNCAVQSQGFLDAAVNLYWLCVFADHLRVQIA
jgi:hypothetical protein